MKTRCIVAAVLLFVAAIIHAVGGELTYIRALTGSAIEPVLKIELRAVWYLVGVDLLLSAVFLVLLIIRNTFGENRMLTGFIGIRMLLYGIAFLLVVVLTDASLLLNVPQWALLLVIGLLLEWDLLRQSGWRRQYSIYG